MNNYKIQQVEWEFHYATVCAENTEKRKDS